MHSQPGLGPLRPWPLPPGIMVRTPVTSVLLVSTVVMEK